MIVTREAFAEVVEKLAATQVVAVDTETTGLRAYQGHHVFSVVFADADGEYYFDFNTGGLPRTAIPGLAPIFESEGVLIGHNLKFDLNMLAKEGLTFNRTLWCTMAQARVEYNQHFKYDLNSCASRIGHEKDDQVKEWMDKNGAYTRVKVEGKKQTKKDYRFWEVPLEVIQPYAEKDARLAYQLYVYQTERFTELDAGGIGAPSIRYISELESRLTGAFFRMEREGLRLDLDYCRRGLEHEQGRISTSLAKFRELSGSDLVDSASSLKGPLSTAGVACGQTEKGSDSYAAAVLEAQAEHPLVGAILDYRDAQKRAGTYWSSFLALAGGDGRIHANLRQAGTATGRTSCSDPNLQNLTADDESEFPIRRAFIPDDGEVLVSIDYQAMEYRLMIDYAQERQLAERVMAGVDLHQATADMMGVTRKEAKTINFGLLYGSGVDKLAGMLGCSRARAQELKYLYFAKLPNVRKFVKTVTSTAERRGYIFNWAGRRCYFPDPRFAYTATNHLIQGGCADIKKVAVVAVDRLLSNRESRILMEIHDELLLGMKRSELHLIPEIVTLMEQAYKPKLLPMKCSVAWSDKSWHDLQDGIPQ